MTLFALCMIIKIMITIIIIMIIIITLFSEGNF